MTRSMIKAAGQRGSKQSGSKTVKQEQSIIRTRSQKLREALARNRSVVEEINLFYMANQREPSAESEDAEERRLADYIHTRDQELREALALARNRSVLEEINTFYTANQREPSAESEDAEERWLADYIQRMRWEWQDGAFGRAVPELTAQVENTIPWFVWGEPKKVPAATAVEQSRRMYYANLVEYATLMLFLYSLGRFVNSVYTQQTSWTTTLSPGAWGLYSWGLWA